MSLSARWEEIIAAGAPRAAVEDLASQDDMLRRNLPFWSVEFPGKHLAVVCGRLVVGDSWYDLTNRLAAEFPNCMFSAYAPERQRCGCC